MNSKYTCDKCNYLTNVKQNYDKHLLSKKHIIKVSINGEQTDHPTQCNYLLFCKIPYNIQCILTFKEGFSDYYPFSGFLQNPENG